MSLTVVEPLVRPAHPCTTGPLAPAPPAGERRASLPVLRLVPAPVSEPPYDDQLPPRPAAAPSTPLGPLALLAAPLRLVPSPPDDGEDEVAPRTAARDLPPARPVAQALVQALLEVLAGVRPLTQLQGATTVELYTELELLVAARPRATRSRPSSGAVRSVHVQQQPQGVAEVCATVHRGKRMAAVALRLEGVGGQWCCTELAGL